MILNLNKLFAPLVLMFFVALSAFSTSAQTRIAVLYSGYTEKFDVNNSHKVIDQITFWELFLMQKKIPYSVIYDRDLESGIVDDYDILILPSVNNISSEELKSMKEFLNSGNSILSVGSKLSVDENDLTNEFKNTNDLLGINCEEFTGEETSFNQYLNFNPAFVEVNGNDGILQISTKQKPLICNPSKSDIASLGFINTNKQGDLQTSMIYGMKDNGKIVWIGFNPDAVIGGKSDAEEFKNLIINSINWLDKKPDVWLSYSPEGKNSATIILIENNINLESELIEKLNSQGIEPYLIISPSQKLSKSVLDEFKSENLILDLSDLSIDGDGFEQKFADEVMKINNQLGINIKIVLAQESLIKNKSILSLLNDVGVTVFLMRENNAELPTVIDNQYLLLPYSSDDRENYLRGGVNFITFKPLILCDKNPEDDFLIKISKTKSSRTWMTNLDALKNWWLTRNKISLTLNPVLENSATLIISNKSSQQITGLNININWKNKININKFTANSGDEIVDYSLSPTGEINLIIDRVGARQEKRIKLLFDKE